MEHGYYLAGDLREVSSRDGSDYLDVYVLRTGQRNSDRVQVKAGTPAADVLLAATTGTGVILSVTAPRLATSRAGKPFLGGLLVTAAETAATVAAA